MRYMVLEGEADFVDTVSAYVSTGWLVPIMNTMLGVCGDLCKSRASGEINEAEGNCVEKGDASCSSSGTVHDTAIACC